MGFQAILEIMVTQAKTVNQERLVLMDCQAHQGQEDLKDSMGPRVVKVNEAPTYIFHPLLDSKRLMRLCRIQNFC